MEELSVTQDWFLNGLCARKPHANHWSDMEWFRSMQQMFRSSRRTAAFVQTSSIWRAWPHAMTAHSICGLSFADSCPMSELPELTARLCPSSCFPAAKYKQIGADEEHEAQPSQ